VWFCLYMSFFYFFNNDIHSSSSRWLQRPCFFFSLEYIYLNIFEYIKRPSSCTPLVQELGEWYSFRLLATVSGPTQHMSRTLAPISPRAPVCELPRPSCPWTALQPSSALTRSGAWDNSSCPHCGDGPLLSLRLQHTQALRFVISRSEKTLSVHSPQPSAHCASSRSIAALTFQ